MDVIVNGKANALSWTFNQQDFIQTFVKIMFN